MPSQGELSDEHDRPYISALQEQMVRAFGYAAVHNACTPGCETVDLSGKMLRDEHVPTLAALMRSAALGGVREINLNWNPQLSVLPDAAAFAMLANLEKVSFVGCKVPSRQLPKIAGGDYADSGKLWLKRPPVELAGNYVDPEKW